MCPSYIPRLHYRSLKNYPFKISALLYLLIEIKWLQHKTRKLIFVLSSKIPHSKVIENPTWKYRLNTNPGKEIQFLTLRCRLLLQYAFSHINGILRSVFWFEWHTRTGCGWIWIYPPPCTTSSASRPLRSVNLTNCPISLSPRYFGDRCFHLFSSYPL